MRKFISTFLILLVGFLFLTGCSKSNIDEINYSDFKKLIDDKETFILYIGSTTCHNCTEFTPKFNNVLNKYNISSVKKIELDKINSDDKDEFNKKINVSGTPTVVFIENGEEESMTNRINGNVDEEKIISRLKSNGYIK